MGVEGGGRLTVDYFCGSRVSYRARATHNQDGAFVDICCLDTRVVVFRSVEDRDFRLKHHGAIWVF
jgi:hypothetical protein